MGTQVFARSSGDFLGLAHLLFRDTHDCAWASYAPPLSHTKCVRALRLKHQNAHVTSDPKRTWLSFAPDAPAKEHSLWLPGRLWATRHARVQDPPCTPSPLTSSAPPLAAPSNEGMADGQARAQQRWPSLFFYFI
mmetsp:Transcript_70669/g.118135  ORF Transcript_70669/g.118135 Transcript_70669/m.118135 type:complete len:135 (-) Transcript_70669:861-1265(-)|eukprot:CAMPEP_0174351594 /NCGR_PEP_ID=MMETSP0811_2-20130205/9006_1 /TAXON_ID=73025 ORGANISM="Eutreptiella gymnastica-like, Strain CCMP1594" /NCGR_SAMPLE_ID=MMETSP0811_2 /ASSEMBLY_ACC=CAM_ASM_000667 /LENGTH=134 /DNA_ID=CAMNT_0015480979 /DNA_START=396 /DNA_END=800 /DNA_ORIENTATION=-